MWKEGSTKTFGGLRFWVFVLATLLPGSCAAIWGPEVISEAPSLIGEHGPSVIVAPAVWLPFAALLIAVYFGHLVVQKIRGHETERYYRNGTLWFASLALVGWAFFWVLIAVVRAATS